MPLFQKSVLNKFIKSQDNVKIETAYQRFSDIFLNEKRQAEIRSMKEEEYQDGFLDDLFVNILGYIKRPNAGFNLVREKKNEADSKKADGAILKNDSPLAVIELKGTDTTDLDKVTNQGFGYKNNHKECVYVVISNFEKLRFFIHHAVDYIEFNLFTLTKEEFTTLWLCLHSDNLLDNIPAKIKAESVVKEEDITKNLYKDYSTFKQELWQDIVKLNPNGDPLQFYKKTQKLIDRFLFIFFAEDAGLLPPNSISRMVDRWKMLKEEDAYKPLYDIFKQYFGYINTGRPGKTPQDEIFAYNGGLMAADEVLETISISDDVLLKHVSRLTTYDFSSEVDVNILGHIFENSLNDIEAVTAELEGQEIDKSKTKRKKDGVFYTPKYITKYIVDNTVGKLCDEKKVELNIVDEEYAKGRTNRKKETLKILDENLQAYRNWLLNITICDPACGSGAFLNQALEYLMEEHRYIDELESQLLGAGFTFPGVENHILENNIFGVDINEESIEIAKLSLWLRTAQRGRKLTSLNNNIKCGNSLIDDPEVAGDKAFNWHKEFPTVFKEKNKFPFHITTSIHDSRTSERMIKYKARERRFDGTKPDPEVFPMTKEEEELIASTVAEIAKEDNLNIAAFNLCWDHMHILLVCEEEEVPKIMQKIKAKTGRAVNIFRGKTIVADDRTKGADDCTKGAGSLDGRNSLYEGSNTRSFDTPRGEKQNSFWTQKYHCKPITSDDQFWNTYNYIENNKVKHNLPKNPKLEKIILGFVKTYEDCFKPEYKGGFDVVIGNPPYVLSREKISSFEKEYFVKHFLCIHEKMNLYMLFTEKAYHLMKYKGNFGFVVPNSWLGMESAFKLREFLLKNVSLKTFINLKGESFPGVNVETVIFTFNKKESLSNIVQYYTTLKPEINELFFNDLEQAKWLNNRSFIFDISSDNADLKVIKRINNSKNSVEDKFDVRVGLQAYETGKGSPKQSAADVKNHIYDYDYKFDQYTYPYLEGRDVGRYSASWSGMWLRWGEWLSQPKEFKQFSEPRILVREITGKFPRLLISTYMEEIFLNNKSIVNIVKKDNGFELKCLLPILNSKLISFFHQRMAVKGNRTLFPKVVIKDIKNYPFPELNNEEINELVNFSDLMLFSNKELTQLKEKFSKYIYSSLNIKDITPKIFNWDELHFSEFIKELNKAIKASGGTPLSKKDEFELMELFEENKKKALELKSQIDQTDKEIDRMVYKLYGLTEEEIQIVENS